MSFENSSEIFKLQKLVKSSLLEINKLKMEIAQLKDEQNSLMSNDEFETLKNESEQSLKQKEDRLLDFYLEGKLEQSTYDSKKAEIESERKRLLDNIEKYKEIDSKMRDKIINIVSIASDLKHVFDMATTSQKSALLKLLLK